MNILKWLFNWKYRFFIKKLGQVARVTLDLEFKLFKVRELREERRKQYDRTVETIDAINAQLKNPANKEETIKELTTRKEEQEKYQTTLKGQIDALDNEVNGVKETGMPGIIEQIEGHRELHQMYRDYIKYNL